MRIALCQINTTVGDLEGNRARCLSAVREAAAAVGRDPAEVTVCVAAPAYVTEDDSPGALAHAREQCRWC